MNLFWILPVNSIVMVWTSTNLKQNSYQVYNEIHTKLNEIVLSETLPAGQTPDVISESECQCYLYPERLLIDEKNSWKQKRNVTKTIRCVQNTYLFTFAQPFQIRLTLWLDGLNNLLFRTWYITSPAWAIWNRVKPRPHLKSIFSAFDQGLQPLLPERSPSLSLTYYSKIVQSISNTSQRVLPTHGCQTTTFIHTCKEIMADRSS